MDVMDFGGRVVPIEIMDVESPNEATHTSKDLSKRNSTT